MSERINISEFARREGCNEKQVRRAIEKGLLTKDSEGLLDASKASSGWRKTNRRGRDAAAQKSSDKSVVRKNVREDAQPEQTIPAPADGETPEQAAERIALFAAPYDRAEAERIKENYLALLKKLEYEQKEGSLVQLATAERVLFESARADRDAWLNWPARVGPLIAADLGLEADRVAEILTEHVHKHVAQLGEPEGDFATAE